MAIPATMHKRPGARGYTDVEVRGKDGKVLGFVIGDDCPKVIALMDCPVRAYSVLFTRLEYTVNPRNRFKHVGGPFAQLEVLAA
jgi:hypothetical protein